MCGDAEVPVRLSTHHLSPRDHEDPLGWETVCWEKKFFSYKLVMVFKTPSYWCWIDSHSVDISSVLYWGWSPGVTHTSHALYSQPRTFSFVHISTWWGNKAIYGHPRNSKLEVSSTSLLTTESWIEFSHLSSFCKAARGMVPPQVSALLFSELYNGLMHGHITLLNIQVEEDMYLKGYPSVSFFVIRWVWREIGTDSEAHEREEHLLSLAFPTPRDSCLGIRQPHSWHAFIHLSFTKGTAF